jgi:hypothetical protein
MQYDSVGQGTDKITMSEIENEIKAVRSKRQNVKLFLREPLALHR